MRCGRSFFAEATFSWACDDDAPKKCAQQPYRTISVSRECSSSAQSKIARNSSLWTLMRKTWDGQKILVDVYNGNRWERYSGHSAQHLKETRVIWINISSEFHIILSGGWYLMRDPQTHTIACNFIWKVEAETESFTLQEKESFLSAAQGAVHQWNALHLIFIIMRAFYKTKICEENPFHQFGFVWSSHLRGIRSLQ